MKFSIGRTSRRFDEQPCPEAKPSTSEECLLPPQYRYYWTIEINSLEDLLDMAHREYPLIVTDERSKRTQIPNIEIYDGYRE